MNKNLYIVISVEFLLPCESWKKAKDIDECWNASYKANNNYLYDSPRS